MTVFRQFEKDVDTNIREDMIHFLKTHTRYYLMNAWNNSTSYANDIKIYNLNIPSKIKDAFYSMLGTDAYDLVSDVLTDFMYRHNGHYQIQSKGRSGEYLVLCNSDKKLSEHKSFCTNCGQRNFKIATENDCKCGRCGKNTRKNYQTPICHYVANFQPIDMFLDFDECDTDCLRTRTKLIQDFDRTCDAYIQALIDLTEEYTVAEKTIYVPQTSSILVKKEKE